MTRRKVVLLILALVFAVAALAVHGFGLLASRRETGLTLSGNVDIRQVDLGFRVGGRIAAIPFDEGARVPVGAVLARLDPALYEAASAAARAQVGIGQAELDKRRKGNREQDIAQARERLAQEQASLLRARADLNRHSFLLRSGAIPTETFELTREQYQTAQAKVSAAAQALSLQRAGTRQEDVEAAVAQLRLAMAQNDKASTDLVDTVLRAPNDGTLLTRAREPGAIVQPGETVVSLTIDRPMRVRAYIDEPDLHRIAPGMHVSVKTDGSARVYHGSIGFIAPTAEFTPKTVQTTALRTDLVYRMRIIVDDPDDGLRQGAPVSVNVFEARPASGK